MEGRVIEFSGVEYMVRGRGYIKSLKDLENIAVGHRRQRDPHLSEGRRPGSSSGRKFGGGFADLDGKGEVAGRHRRGAVRRKRPECHRPGQGKDQKQISQPSLPKGVKIVTTYDRSDLIHRSIDTLKDEIIKLAIAVSVVCIIFLFHLPSALVVILTLPVAIIISFISCTIWG